MAPWVHCNAQCRILAFLYEEISKDAEKVLITKIHEHLQHFGQRYDIATLQRACSPWTLDTGNTTPYGMDKELQRQHEVGASQLFKAWKLIQTLRVTSRVVGAAVVRVQQWG